MTDHIDEIQQRLESILQRLAPLRNQAADSPLPGYDSDAANKAFDALHAEANNIVQSSPDRTVRALGSRFLVLERWQAFEPAGSLTYSSTAAQTKPAAKKHQVAEMCAKLAHEIREFIRDDLPSVRQPAARERKISESAVKAINAAFPDGPPTLLQMPGPVFCRKVRDHLPKDWAGSDRTILRAGGRMT